MFKGVFGELLQELRKRKKEKRKKKKAAKPRIVLSASLSDSEREVGCGAKPHCYRLRAEKAA